MNKLARNQLMLEEKRQIENGEIEVIRNGGLPRSLVQNYCLNCDKSFVTMKSKQMLFCSGECAMEFNKRKSGLI